MEILEIGILNQFGQPVVRKINKEILESDPMLFSAIFTAIQYCLQESYEDVAEEMIFKKQVIHCKAVHSANKDKFMLLYAITKRKGRTKRIQKIFKEIIRRIDIREIFEKNNSTEFSSSFDHLQIIIEQVLDQQRLSWRDIIQSFS